MRRFLRIFDAYQSLERALDEKSFEIIHLRTVVEKLEAQLASAHADHKRDLRKVADAESYQFTRRKVFAGSSQSKAAPQETENIVPARMTARAQVRQAQQKFADQIRELGAKSA